MSDDFLDYELEREANIARNREILAKLDIEADLPSLKRKEPVQTSAKPVQPAKKVKREKEPAIPIRQSARLKRTVVDPNETPAKKHKREKEEAEQRAKEEEERLEVEERARQAKKPRHHDLDLSNLLDESETDELITLRVMLQTTITNEYSRRTGAQDAFVYEDEKKEEAAVTELRGKLEGLKIVARAKVTQDRIYSAAYHPEPTKDLIFFGDKHGQLGIWDARAPADEATDEDGEANPAGDGENGKYWRLQAHWPATAKSSISCVKFDPLDSHSVLTSAYDCTIRALSFVSGVSREIFSAEEALISCFDLPPTGNEMWISDATGGLTHLDLREDKSKAKWFQLSDQKIGTVSINPTNPHYLVTASNSRAMKIWDARKVENIPVSLLGSSSVGNRNEFDQEVVEKYVASSAGKGCLRAEWRHGKSVSAAFWDPRGRSIVSTSYDDTLRLWEISGSVMTRNTVFPSSRPFAQLKHDCQTGRWLTVLKAQWSPNPDCYPHFTIGNMGHSLDIFSCKGDLVARLSDRQKITAVQAVTCSHPGIIERVASGNASGRCVLWAPSSSSV
ncbi:WD40 repeat-like protein [Wolfiporia cocos MD-104 SS10]|uniref:DNA damage-binding protein CMR1 n=1 Tax=Wolfiporia cocos (strain MD-104) TaxID=742152 RepID=A0A2H3J864_WOLCO|nr:WD40 repeat-like protein [Wolfiporia cocos MD-104 SS10]